MSSLMARARSLGIFGKVALVGVIGMVGALLLGAVSISNFAQVEDEVVERSRITVARDAAVQLSLRNMDISGWQLGVMGDVYRLGAQQGMTGDTAVNLQGLDEAIGLLDEQLDSFPRDALTPEEATLLAAVEQSYADFSPLTSRSGRGLPPTTATTGPRAPRP